MSGATSKWVVLGDLVISVTGQGLVGDEGFHSFLQDLRKDPIKKYLAASLGKPEATSLQRKQMADVLKARGIRMASVTDDAVTRGLVTAMSWLGANIKAFSWVETKAVVQYLDIHEPFATKALDTLARLRKEVEVKIR